MTARVSFADRARRVGMTVVWLAVYTLVGVGGSVVLLGLNPVPVSSSWFLAVNALGLALPFAFATWLVGIRLTRHTWDQLGWHTAGGLAHRVVNGVTLGVVMSAVAIGLAFIGSGATLRLTHDWSRWAGQVLPIASLLLVAALAEELTFRGLPLRLLADAFGPVAAMLVLAGGFAVAHARNPHAGAFGIVNVALAAIWLSFAFFSPGGMGLAWGLHFGWNAGLAVLFDAPVSGYAFQVPAIDYRPGAHAWVDGGAFGPEGGLAATVVLIAGTLAVIGKRFRQPKEWLL